MSERYGRAEGLGTSWTSVLIGWLAALGASLILSGIVGAVVSMILGTLGFGGVSEAGTSGLVGVLLTLFLAFLIGGYAAGRMAGREGSKHGLLVALLALIITLILALLRGAVGFNLIENLRGVTLPGIPSKVSQQGLGTVLTLGSVLALLLPFVAGALGGSWGARTDRWRL